MNCCQINATLESSVPDGLIQLHRTKGYCTCPTLRHAGISVGLHIRVQKLKNKNPAPTPYKPLVNVNQKKVMPPVRTWNLVIRLVEDRPRLRCYAGRKKEARMSCLPTTNSKLAAKSGLG